MNTKEQIMLVTVLIAVAIFGIVAMSWINQEADKVYHGAFGQTVDNQTTQAVTPQQQQQLNADFKSLIFVICSTPELSHNCEGINEMMIEQDSSNAKHAYRQELLDYAKKHQLYQEFWFHSHRYMSTFLLDYLIKTHKAECYDNMILKLNNTIGWGHC